MATSNRDRIGKMFELLAPALNDFIARSVAPQQMFMYFTRSP